MRRPLRVRGVTLIELLAAMSLMLLTLTGTVAMVIGGLRSFQRTSTGVDQSESNAQAMRRITETLRQAVSVAVSQDGKSVQFQLPELSETADPVTGERELLDPIQADGVQRSFLVVGTELIDGYTGRTLVRDVVATDPDPASSSYGQTYSPFELGTVGATRAITVTSMTRKVLSSGASLHWRLKSTVLLRNTP